MSFVYLDHAAATPVLKEVQDVLNAVPKNLGNPSSVHQSGSAARMQIDNARQNIADYFECGVGEVLFTSGATESLNLAIIGSVLPLVEKNAEDVKKNILIYLSPLSHEAIWGACRFLQKHFSVKIKYLPVNKQGQVDTDEFELEIQNNWPDLVVCEHGNSEVGILQPVSKIGKILLKQSQEQGSVKPVFVVDSAASVVTEKISLEYQKCDLIALSGEKFGAFSGIGILLKKEKVHLESLQNGSQEFGYRGGTENWQGIIAMKEALSWLSENQKTQNSKYREFQDRFKEFFKKEFPKIKIISQEGESLLHIFHFILPLESEKSSLFVIQADLQRLCISAGSACSSGSVGGSKVLKALGYSDSESERGVRISFGWNTTTENIEKSLGILKKLI